MTPGFDWGGFLIAALLLLALLLALLILSWFGFLLRFAIRGTPVPRSLLYATPVALCLAAGAYVGFVRPLALRGRQVSALADMQSIARFVETYKDERGQYPRALSEALPGKWRDVAKRDPWGAPFYFESDGTYYVLVSRGKDRSADFADYRHIRDASPTCEQDWHACDVRGLWNADQIRSDRGWHRQAGK
jgi:hypothetical protein